MGTRATMEELTEAYTIIKKLPKALDVLMAEERNSLSNPTPEAAFGSIMCAIYAVHGTEGVRVILREARRQNEDFSAFLEVNRKLLKEAGIE